MVMSKTEELVALLIERAEYLHDPEAYHGDIREVMLNAADHIQAQQALINELVGALEPLAKFDDVRVVDIAASWARSMGGDWDAKPSFVSVAIGGETVAEFRVEDATRASAALNRAREENSNE